MAATYAVINPRGHALLVTQIDGTTIVLAGTVEAAKAAQQNSRLGPAATRSQVRLATQEDLARLYSEKHPFVTKSEDAGK